MSIKISSQATFVIMAQALGVLHNSRAQVHLRGHGHGRGEGPHFLIQVQMTLKAQKRSPIVVQVVKALKSLAPLILGSLKSSPINREDKILVERHVIIMINTNMPWLDSICTKMLYQVQLD